MSGGMFQLEPNGRSAQHAGGVTVPTGTAGNGTLAISVPVPQLQPQQPLRPPPPAPPHGKAPPPYGGGQAIAATTEAGFTRNPLLCMMCNQAYQNPCLLACYHTFCAACLRGRAVDGKLACPLCGKVTPLRDGHSLPPSDHLLRFLVESTCEEFPTCANCDRNEKSPMFFCNTCGQALCGQCRDETHRAKMFSQHEVIHMSKRAKDQARKCLLHGEPFTMFCTTKKAMLCMKCFRDTSAEARRYCVDLDTAYNQGAKKLERALTSIRELQNSLRDGVNLFRALLDELRHNMETERDGIQSTYAELYDTIKKQYEILIKDLESQYTTKDGELKAQLHSVGTLLPTVQMHLILCTTFTSTANKHEFLTMAYQLIDRLTALAHLTYPLRPGHTSEIKTDYKTTYASSLEPITARLSASTADASSSSTVAVSGIGGSSAAKTKSVLSYGMGTYPPHRSSATRANAALSAASNTVEESNASRFAAAGGATLSRLHMMQQQGPTQANEAIKRQTMSARGLSDKEFTKHCRGFDGQIKGLNNKFNSIKNQVSDLHRDVTTRRCLTSYKRVENIVVDCAALTDELEKTDQLMKDRKELFHKMWEEEQQRIMTEQTIFKEQLSELCSLRDDLRQLMGIAQQLEPYIKSITTLMEQIQPEVGGAMSSGGGGEGGVAEPQGSQQQQQQGVPAQSKSTQFTTAAAAGYMKPHPPPDHERAAQALSEHLQMVSDYKQRLDSQVRQQVEVVQGIPPPPPPPQQGQQRMSPFDELLAQHHQQLQRERHILRASSREGTLGTTPPKQRTLPLEDMQPVRDTSRMIPMPPPMQAMPERKTTILTDDFPLAEPPFEYSTPAVSDIPRKTLNETTADVKRGILSSILEKVRSKEEAAMAAAASSGSAGTKPQQRLLAPLASSESLTVSEASSKRLSAAGTDSSVVVKPYEPPGLGKPSRVTPVGLDEEPHDHLSTDSLLESDNVEVLSVIRFNKSKLGSSTTGTTCSEKRSSSSDTASLFNNSSCPACDAAAAAASDATATLFNTGTARRVRSRSATRPESNTSQEAVTTSTTASTTASATTTTGSLPSIISAARRSSAPEIDENTLPSSSEVTSMASSSVAPTASEAALYCRSLERPRHHRPPSDSSACSDSESTTNTIPRYSVGSVDRKDLQRAVAHLQETLHERMYHQHQSEVVKAVVHQRPEAGSSSNGASAAKTLDGDAIKHHESIKRNVTSSMQHHLGPYDTMKPSRVKRQSSGDKVDNSGGGKRMTPPSASTSTSTPAVTLKKADSFEGHEEAVRTLVEAVHESRKFEQQQQDKPKKQPE